MRLFGAIRLPGDKSITHRALMLNAISSGVAKIYNPLISEDIKTTTTILQALGVNIEINENVIMIKGVGFSGLKKPIRILDCQNSGTTARLMLGLLTGLEFPSSLTGDSSLLKRPMLRVVKHLRKLNGKVNLTDDNFLPADIMPSKIKTSEIFLDVSSAQVKSAVILASLKSQEETIIHELSKSRNHTELMLEYLGCDIKCDNLTITISGRKPLIARDIIVPGDISSAAFFIVACLIIPDSRIIVSNCGLNPTRMGILSILDQIGAHYKIINKKVRCNEIVGDIEIVYHDGLKPFIIEKELVPLLIDEIPILTLLASQIKGTSYIKDASELRVKESDRIKAVASSLNLLGCKIKELADGLIIEGRSKLQTRTVDTFNDHRLSMMLKIARLLNPNIEIINPEIDKISYPNFENDLKKLLK